MKNKTNILILAALILYVLSPVDAVPGPIDDVILMVIYAIANGVLALRHDRDVVDAEE